MKSSSWFETPDSGGWVNLDHATDITIDREHNTIVAVFTSGPMRCLRRQRPDQSLEDLLAEVMYAVNR